MTRHRSLRLATLLLLAACGDASTTGAGAPEVETGGPAGSEAPARSSLPSVEMTDVATGDAVALARLLPADKPLLLWFWAPN